MASGFDAQYAAANDPDFKDRVTLASMIESYSVYTEATSLNANLPAVATTSIPITPALTSSIPAGTVITIGGTDTAVLSATAAVNSTTLTVTSFTPSRVWVAGTFVSPPSLSNHPVRANLAFQIMSNPTNFTLRFALSCAAQGLDDTSTDAAIQSGCALVWNLIAGA